MAVELGGIDTARIAALMAAERAVFIDAHPRSAAEAGQGLQGFYHGVPMHWMRDWPMPFPLLVESANGASLTDIDGHILADFCLGDTGSMFGHSPPAVAAAIARQASLGLTYMLPTQDAAAVGRLLQQRFGLPHWQVAGSATDANRFALRVARAATGRPKILVFNGCYHGTVDETFVRLVDGTPVNRPGLLGQVTDLTAQTKVVEFNDLPALEAALADRDIACVITEPVLTNCCMVLPDPDFHRALRRLTRQTGTLLLIDETHTISTGPAGYCGRYGLEPDIFVLGKPVAGGVPAAVWGFTDPVAAGLDRARAALPPGHSGMGTTLSANALSLAAMRACLEQVMTPDAYAHMESLAEQLAQGLTGAIDAAGLPWHVVRVGARVEFICAPGPLRNGTEAEAAHAGPLEQAIHLALLNRGCLIAPFHNMMLLSPVTEAGQVARLISAFSDVTRLLTAKGERA
ncbi:aspartate aminotransferase family protein [Niveispirillum sp. BGYR6]|uniref:aspartate aminotransferase family protein n=1 Tax=Niveispirillum sp. BGYR6 TaxID=2971249 RepID=UPI0022B97ADA|nr:aspartate aminotransferase family protein [Niveispirillum sp. BGYR6]MDG5493582.1 aspartate aminotransferase family protein [Niveispirillum sp. BGYR6]